MSEGSKRPGSLPAPVFDDGIACLYHGDARELLPLIGSVGVQFDAAIVDPPYAETSLAWDRWVDGWPDLLERLVPTFWCFGSFRMFFDRRAEFAEWKHAQEVVWEKHNGSALAADRFKRVHELVVQFYRGPWANLRQEVPTTPDATARQVRRKERPAHWGAINGHQFESVDGGPRLMRSVQYVRSEHGSALHPTQKPVGILEPLISYSVAPGGMVLDPFAGAASSLIAARNIGRRSIGIEADAECVDQAIRRLRVGTLNFAACDREDEGSTEEVWAAADGK